MMESFGQIAEGATALRVRLRKGDMIVRTDAGTGWTLRWSSQDDQVPQVTREGDTLVVEQPSAGWDMFGKRMDIELLVPASVRALDLNTGHGNAEVHGIDGELKLHSGHGRMLVRGGSGDVLLATGHGEVTFEDHRGGGRIGTGHGRVHVERVEGDLEIETGHGHAELTETSGRVRLTTGHGHLQAVNCAGTLDVRSGHGKAEIVGARALGLRVDLGNGNIEVEGGSLAGGRLKTGRGDVTCRAALGPGSYEMNTGMGDIDTGLAPTARARIEAHTSFGRIESAFPLVQVGRSGPPGVGGGRMVGSIGEGDPEIELTLRTGKGSLRLHRAEGPQWERPWRRPGAADDWSSRTAAGARFDVAAERIFSTAAERVERVAERIEKEVAPKVEEQVARAAERFEKEVAPRIEEAVGRFVGGSVRSPQNPMPPVPPTPPEAPPVPPQPAAPSEADATMKILEAVARGEITPQEAEALLGRGRR